MECEKNRNAKTLCNGKSTNGLGRTESCSSGTSWLKNSSSCSTHLRMNFIAKKLVAINSVSHLDNTSLCIISC